MFGPVAVNTCPGLLWRTFWRDCFSWLLVRTVGTNFVVYQRMTETKAADWGFISNFLLTYRRFASPRSVVLAMQKRMRQLNQTSDDPMFACYAQMRYGKYVC